MNVVSVESEYWSMLPQWEQISQNLWNVLNVFQQKLLTPTNDD